MKKFIFLLALACSIVCQAQDIIVLNSGESIKGYKLDLTPADVIYYQVAEDDANSLRKIERKDIMVIRLVDGTIYNPNEAKQPNAEAKQEKGEEVSQFPDIDLTDYHGYLLEKGNCVYVAPNSDEEWDGFGVERIKEHLKRIGYWTVVDKPEQAHFILQYGVCLTGQDRGFYYVRTRKSYQEFPTCIYDVMLYRVKEPESARLIVSYAGEDRSSVYGGVDNIFSAFFWKKIVKDIEKRKRFIDFIIP